MHKPEECSIFGVLPVRMKFIKFAIVSVVFSMMCIAAMMLLTFLNPNEETKPDESGVGTTVEKDYAVAANSVMTSLLVVCLVALYALWKKIPNLLLPYVLYKVLLITWLTVYLSVLVMDDTVVLDFGPDIYPLRLLVEKERHVRKDSELFPVILFIVCLELIVLETHSVIIVYRCRKSMLHASLLKISSASAMKKRDNVDGGGGNKTGVV